VAGTHPLTLNELQTLDAKVQSDASKISSNYAALVALSIRQSLATVEITVSKTSTGAWNTSDVLTFMKGMFLCFIKEYVELIR
jgi:hypothetical protein